MLTLLAQAASQPARQPSLLESPLPVLVIFGVVFWLIVFRPRSAEQKKFQQMLATLKKGDRVQTIGGVLGTVVNLTDREVTLKVDESNNTKMTFVRAAIKEVLRGDAPPAK